MKIIRTHCCSCPVAWLY